jgi:hypothetical protein
VKAGGNNPRVVQDEQVVRQKIVDEVAEGPMLQGSSFALKDEEPGSVARLRGSLGDLLLRQIVIVGIGLEQVEG